MLAGKSGSLDAAELIGGRLHIHFKDRANGLQTYMRGRHLQTEAVSADGFIYLDFNKAYNPPSAFSEFAICSFASKHNELKFPVEASELYFAV
jgi:uncharacterized protein (DUF1684 family)